MRRRRRALVTAAAIAALSLAACGGDDFENDPRPAVPEEVSVEIAEDGVVVSPSEFGAGLVNFTIVNLGDTSASLAIDGPISAESDEIAPQTNTTLKTDLRSGEYEAIAQGTSAASFEFSVGPDRESAQDELLLP